ncbi:MAG: hypothetical protein M1837_002387 [Sclerophora amabilis]|nr:MAG: hypothetical protein M1837_002387 [Sclerophora amabilis]
MASSANGTSTTMRSNEKCLDTYGCPRNRMTHTMLDSTKTPLCLVSCGSFSPITYLHLRMFVMAADYVKFNTDFEVCAAYLSPVSSAYKKAGLASAQDRINMCTIAANESSKWIMCSPWEATQEAYTPTAAVLDYFDHQINDLQEGVETSTGERKRVRIALLAGADLLATMSKEDVWDAKDLDHILGKYGAFIIERSGTVLEDHLSSLQTWQHNIFPIQQLIKNEVSSTKIRLSLRRRMSIEYLIPRPVITYINEHGLYTDDGPAGSTSTLHERGKGEDGRPAVEGSSKS